jgi:uncharacterized membrane protein YidH (DUF202 family)
MGLTYRTPGRFASRDPWIKGLGLIELFCTISAAKIQITEEDLNMAAIEENKTPVKSTDRRDHLANERTFLAWVRTSIGIMAFGFVVEKFALFIKKLPYFFAGMAPKAMPSSPDYSQIFGIALVVIGALMGLLAFLRYKRVEREINEDKYKPSILLDILVTMLILTMGVFLAFYMLHSIFT